MKLKFLCTVLLLAGAVSSSSVGVDSDSIKAWGAEAKLDIPDWVIELIQRLPESIQEIIDRLPEIIAQIPGILEQIPEIIAAIIDWIPEIIPIIIDKIPEIIAQIPAAIDVIKDILQQIIDKLPELIPIILEKIPDIIAAIPEIYDRIREILESLDLPDWFPTLPDLEKPEWWPDGLPSLPDINKAVPGTLTSVSEYPSIAQMEVGTGPIWLQGCVCVILTNFHCLTSARCVSGKLYQDRFRRIRAGSSTRLEGGIIIFVNNVVIHPDFAVNGNFDADIAVVRLSSNLQLGGDIQQVAIVPQGFSLPAGLSVEVVGWGSTAQGGVVIDRNLYKIDLVVVDRDTCVESYARIPVISITENMVCLARPETGGRNGDIRDMGAPVYFQNTVATMQSISVVGNQGFEVVTTNIGSFSDWIVHTAV